MAVTALDSTAKATTANSYGTIVGWTQYETDQFGGFDVEGLSEENQTRSLLASTKRLELEFYKGTRTDDTTPQALEWPRAGVLDRHNDEFDNDTVPTTVIEAQYELATHLAKELCSGAADCDLTALESLKIPDVIDVTFREGQVDTVTDIPDTVWLLLRDVLLPQAAVHLVHG